MGLSHTTNLARGISAFRTFVIHSSNELCMNNYSREQRVHTTIVELDKVFKKYNYDGRNYSTLHISRLKFHRLTPTPPEPADKPDFL